MRSQSLRNIIFYLLHAIAVGFFLIIHFVAADELAETRNQSFALSYLETGLAMGSFFGLVYLVYWVFLPQYLVRGQYRKFFLIALTILIAYPIFYYSLGGIFEFIFGFRESMLSNIPIDGLVGMSMFTMLIGSLFRIFFQWFRDAHDKIELEKQNLKGELDMLKNQLNPHFLFNSLNNIDALIHAQSPHASLALNKLSDMMRYMVYDSEKEWVTLEEELNYIENYISLQRLRLVNQDLIQFKVNGYAGGQPIAPMLFISFVENSFKHASLRADAPPIEIDFDLAEDHLRFSCRNAVAQIQKDGSSGVGLENVLKRLDLLYRDQHRLAIDQSNGFFHVSLELSL